MDAVKPIPMYEALDKHGAPYMRLAKRIHELPEAKERKDALHEATASVAQRIGLQPKKDIAFGTPVFIAFGLTRQQVKHMPETTLLLQTGSDLSLALCPSYGAVE